MDASLARLQFSARILVNPKFVSNGYGAVLGRAAPFAFSARLHRNCAVKVADACNACRRIPVFVRSRVRCNQTSKTRHTEQEGSASGDRCPVETIPADPFCCVHGESPVLGRDAGRLAAAKIHHPADRSYPTYNSYGCRTPGWERSCHQERFLLDWPGLES